MKIFVEGSKRSAIARLFPAWKKLGHQIVETPQKADVQLAVIRIRNKTGLPVVLRLDGVYYDMGRNYKQSNSSIGKSHHKADAVIYQSECSKAMCERYLAKRTTDIFQVVHNGIDPTVGIIFKNIKV